jgi:methyl-accepting chemotaxis protein
MSKMNCWEAIQCAHKEQCPAYPEKGRLCLAVTGTLCRGEKQGSYMEKVDSCREKCAFYKDVIDGVYENV